MKTIWDAVNEFEGVWGGGDMDEYLHFESSKSLWHHCRAVDMRAFIGDYNLVCDVKEFNALVTEMSLGLDVNPVNDGYYHKYLDADKEILKPTPVIDWDSAPEGATHYCPSNKQFSEVFIKDLTDDGYSYKVVGGSYVDNEWEYTNPIVKGELHGIVKRPIKQELNIYTQEMSDNGELPPIGSLFIDIELSNDDQVEAMAHDLELGRVIYKRGSTLQDSEYFGAQAHECKPIPAKVDLINGKAYQFDFNSEKALEGIYSKHVFYCVDNDYSASVCTNIKPLTVD